MENEKMGIKVLSLFDGISCGNVALERVGIKVDKYFASEICDYSIKIGGFKIMCDTLYHFRDNRLCLHLKSHRVIE